MASLRQFSFLLAGRRKMLFDQLLEPAHLPADLIGHIRNFRTYSTAFKVNVAAERPLLFSSFDAASSGFEVPNYVHIGPDIEYLQAAYNDACDGRYSARRLALSAETAHWFGDEAPAAKPRELQSLIRCGLAACPSPTARDPTLACNRRSERCRRVVRRVNPTRR